MYICIYVYHASLYTRSRYVYIYIYVYAFLHIPTPYISVSTPVEPHKRSLIYGKISMCSTCWVPAGIIRGPERQFTVWGTAS